jgi:hypothetical protein
MLRHGFANVIVEGQKLFRLEVLLQDSQEAADAMEKKTHHILSMAAKEQDFITYGNL